MADPPAATASAGLAEIRSELAAAVGALVGIANTYAGVPRAPVRPCVIVNPATPYMEPAGPNTMYRVAWDVLLVSDAETPEDATDELDGYLDLFCAQPGDGFFIDDIGGPAAFGLAGGTYPGCQIRLSAHFCFD